MHEISPFLSCPAGLYPNGLPEDQPVSFNLNQEYFPEIMTIIRQGNYSQGQVK